MLLDEWAETVFRSPGPRGADDGPHGRRPLARRPPRRAACGAARPSRCATRCSSASRRRCAIVPGTSRSGATISMALFLGHRREAAARFSFLLALPITAGRRPRQGAAPLPRRGRPRPGARRACWRRRSRASWPSASCSPTCARATTCRSSSTASPSRLLVWGAALGRGARTWDRVACRDPRPDRRRDAAGRPPHDRRDRPARRRS